MKKKTLKSHSFHINKPKTKTLKHRQPQHDFYAHVNDAWIQSQPSPKIVHERNIYTIMQKRVDKELQTIIQKTPSLNKIYESFTHCKPSHVVQTIHDYTAIIDYFCDHHHNHNHHDTRPFYDFLVFMNRHGMSCPINYNVDEDPKDNQYVISTLEGGNVLETNFTFEEKHAYHKAHAKINMEHYLHQVFSLVFGKHHPYMESISHIFSIEEAFIQCSLPEKDMSDMTKLYNKFPASQVQTKLGFDFLLFCQCLGFSEKDRPNEVLIQNPKYIQHATQCLKPTWSDPSWRAYWVYQVIRLAIPFHSILSKTREQFLSRFYVLSDENKSKRALQFVSLLQNTCLNERYLAFHKHSQERQEVSHLVMVLKKAFKERILRNPWLSKHTKTKMMEKLHEMKCIIGYEDHFEKGSDPDASLFSPDNGMHNQIVYNKWQMERNLKDILQKKLGRHPKNKTKNLWIRNTDINTYDVNAFYDLQWNQMIIPNAIMEPPFWDPTQGIAHDFANMGTTIGHEMFHAFDDEGYQYDAFGNYTKVWTEVDAKEYKKRIHDVERQYVEFAKRDGYHISTDLIVGENLSDIVGFLIAEDALVHSLETQGVTPEELTHILKEFYVHYAKQWRSNVGIPYMKKRVGSNVHSLAKYRVNCVLARSPRFQTIYQIRPGDAMFYDAPVDIL